MANVTDISCGQRQGRCQWRFWALISANFVFTCSSFIGSWSLYASGAGRATVSETKSAEMRREVDKNEGRAEGTVLSFGQINTLLLRIQTDLDVVKLAVARLEVQAERGRLDGLPNKGTQP